MESSGVLALKFVECRLEIPISQRFVRTYMCSFIYTYIHTYIHLYILIIINTYTHTYICSCIHTLIHTYTHTYICSYTQRRVKVLGRDVDLNHLVCIQVNNWLHEDVSFALNKLECQNITAIIDFCLLMKVG